MKSIVWTTLCLIATQVSAQPREPHRYFRDIIGLSDAEIRQVEQGQVVVKVLETPLAHEVAIFGAVWVEATSDYFLEMYQDIENFEKGEGILQIHKIGEPLQLEDFTAIRFPGADIKAIPKCKIGKCDVKIDEASLVRLQSEIDWKAPDAESKAQSLIAELAYEGIREYQKGGDATLAAYRDKKRPTYLAKEFKGMLENSSFLYEYFPEFHDYLLDYPKAELPGGTDFFYWSMNEFGLKPLFRMNHRHLPSRRRAQCGGRDRVQDALCRPLLSHRARAAFSRARHRESHRCRVLLDQRQPEPLGWAHRFFRLHHQEQSCQGSERRRRGRAVSSSTLSE